MSDQLTLTIDPLQDAIWWRDHNPEAADYYVEIARRDVRNGIQPSSDFCGHMVRRSGLLTRRGSGPVFNDHLTSALARLFKRELGIPFNTREAAADRMGVGP